MTKDGKLTVGDWFFLGLMVATLVGGPIWLMLDYREKASKEIARKSYLRGEATKIELEDIREVRAQLGTDVIMLRVKQEIQTKEDSLEEAIRKISEAIDADNP